MVKRVMVIDDDPVVRLLVNEFLSSKGYSVEAAESGPEALTMMSSSRPDIVILDLLMPEMSGIELLKHLRGDPTTAKLPIVMMSSDFDTEAITNSYNVSADTYIQKPFGMKDILSAVEQVDHAEVELVSSTISSKEW